jgi:DNA-binding NtrC family response regulator
MTNPSGDMLRCPADKLGAFPREELVEELWRDLLGAPTIIGVSPAARSLREALPSAANSRDPLFIRGESGSGRRLLAIAVHRAGPRSDRPFIAENLAMVPEALRETGLFGAGGKPGLLDEAGEGTLYLAGVEHLPPRAQERLAARLGQSGGQPGPCPPPRLIASADEAPGGAVRHGRLQRELADLLSVFVLEVPPLRARPEDIPLIAEHLLRRRATAMGTNPPVLAPETVDALKMHSWPDNVRGLDEELSLAAAGRATIMIEHLSPAVSRAGRGQTPAGGNPLREAVSVLEMSLISQALADTNWNKSRAARALGLSRLGLQKKIDRYEIDRRR